MNERVSAPRGAEALLFCTFCEQTAKFLQKGAGNEFATKVVPIISIGTGKQIGAVQVTGSQALVNKTEAVLQVEGSLLGSVRVRALIPSDSVNPLKFNRVQGVGVSALVDISI